MEFSHPLARRSKVWSSEAHDGSAQRVLVIITTLALDRKSKRFKPKLVERLSSAARKFLVESKDATSFLMMNRPREWDLSAP